MAIFHYSIKLVKRSEGHSAIAAAAYQSRSRLRDPETGRTHDYSRRKDLIYKEVMLCEHAPPAYKYRKTLWAAVQQSEHASNAQLARNIEIALPVELEPEEQIGLVRSYIKSTFVEKGMCADFSIHCPDGKPSNPHVHILLTLRGIREDGTWDVKERKEYELDPCGNRIPIIDSETGRQKVGKGNRKQWKRVLVKANDWNDRELAETWRSAWAEAVNEALQKKGLKVRVDHRSYIRQGSEKIPTQHEGTAARKLESNGGVSERCEENRQIRSYNQAVEIGKTEAAELGRLIHKRGQLDERARRLLQGRRDSHTGRRVAESNIGAIAAVERAGKIDWKDSGKKPCAEKSCNNSAKTYRRPPRR